MIVLFAVWMYYAKSLNSQKPAAPPPVQVVATGTLPSGLQLETAVAKDQFQKAAAEETAAEKSADKDEKKKHYEKAIEYLQVVVKQEKNTSPDALTAAIESARLQSTEAVDQKQQASAVLNNLTLLHLPPDQKVSVMADGSHWSAQPVKVYAAATYDSLVQTMNRDNSKKFAYKFFHFFVGIFTWAGQYKDALALISLGLLVTVLMTPVRNWQYKSMGKFAKMQPDMKKLQEKYKGQPEELHRQSMALYKQHGTNPMTGCLPMVAQIPFMWWLWYAIRLYQFNFKGSFIWIGSAFAKNHVAWATPNGAVMAVNLGHPDLPLVLLYAISMYFSSKFMPMTTADPEQQKQSQKMSATMSLFMPVMFYFYNLPSAFILWSLAMNVAQILVTVLYLRHHPDLKAMYEASAAAQAKKPTTPADSSAGKPGTAILNGKRGLSNGVNGTAATITPVSKNGGAVSKDRTTTTLQDGIDVDGQAPGNDINPVRRIEPRNRRKGRGRRY